MRILRQFTALALIPALLVTSIPPAQVMASSSSSLAIRPIFTQQAIPAPLLVSDQPALDKKSAAMAREVAGKAGRDTPLNVAEFLQEVLSELVNETLYQVQLQVETQAGEYTLDSVRAFSKYMLGFVIKELVDNAMKYSYPGAQVYLRLSRVNGDILIKITDHGIGISPADLLSIGTLHYRAANARHHIPRSRGLGLSFVSEYLKKYFGGTYEITSPGIGLGTTVTIKIPVSNSGSNPSLSQSPKDLFAAFVLFDLALQTHVALGVAFFVVMAPTLWISILGIPKMLRPFLDSLGQTPQATTNHQVVPLKSIVPLHQKTSVVMPSAGVYRGVIEFKSSEDPLKIYEHHRNEAIDELKLIHKAEGGLPVARQPRPLFRFEGNQSNYDISTSLFFGNDRVYLHLHTDYLSATPWFFEVDLARLREGQLKLSAPLSGSMDDMYMIALDDLDTEEACRVAERDVRVRVPEIMATLKAWQNAQEDRLNVYTIQAVRDAQGNQTPLMKSSKEYLSKSEIASILQGHPGPDPKSLHAAPLGQTRQAQKTALAVDPVFALGVLGLVFQTSTVLGVFLVASLIPTLWILNFGVPAWLQRFLPDELDGTGLRRDEPKTDTNLEHDPSGQIPRKTSWGSLREESVGQAKARIAEIDLSVSDISLDIDRTILDYDFSQYATFPMEGRMHRPIEGKTLREWVEKDQDVIVAIDGGADNLQTENSLVVSNGQLIQRHAPGVLATKRSVMHGSYSFFVLDSDRLGIADVSLQNGQPQSPIHFKTGISGAVLIRNGSDVYSAIHQAQPNVAQNQVAWDPEKQRLSLSVLAKSEKGQPMLIAVHGDPEQGTDPLLREVVDQLLALRVTDAIYLGASADVQQYVRGEDQPYVIAKARQGSDSAQAYPNGRPLFTVLKVRHRLLGQTPTQANVEGDTPLNVAEFLQEVRTELEREENLYGVHLQVDATAGDYTLGLVKNDSKKGLRFVFRELVINAMKYSHPDARVFLRLSRVNDDILVEIKDQGIGISPEDLSQIRKQRYRAANARHHVPVSPGLGLPLAAEVLKNNFGGSYEITSPGIGLGTTVTIKIPVSNSGSNPSLSQSPKELFAAFVLFDLALQTHVALGVAFFVVMAPTLWISILGIPKMLRPFLGMGSTPAVSPIRVTPPLVKMPKEDPFPRLMFRSPAQAAESLKVKVKRRPVVGTDISHQFVEYFDRIQSLIKKYDAPQEQYDVSDHELAGAVHDMSLFIQTSRHPADVLFLASLLRGVLSDLELLAPSLADELRLSLSIAKITCATSHPSFFSSLMQGVPRDLSGFLFDPLLLTVLFESFTEVHWGLGIALGLVMTPTAWIVSMGIPKWLQPYWPHEVLSPRSWTRQAA